MPPTVLIVDDEAPLAAAIEAFLARQGLTARAYGTAEGALAAMAELAPDIALVDIQLPGMDGLSALTAIRRERPETLVILMTAYSSVPGAVAALRGGAVDYLVKPVDLEELWVVIQRAWETHRVRGELSYLRQRAGHAAPVESLLGTSPAMAAVRRQLLQVAAADRLGVCGADGPADRRDRDRQGAGRARDPRGGPARRRPLRRAELRGHSRHAPGG